jgi:dTMP kinase
MTARFIVFEGSDGSGKSTQAARLAEMLRARGIDVHETFEPGAGRIGRVLRDLLLHGAEPVTARAEALLMAADRAEHVEVDILPALGRGEWVVCDRYVPSSLVYQGVARGLGVDIVERLNAVATGGLVPDVVVVLDVPESVASARRTDAPDRMEGEGSNFLGKVGRAYRELATIHGWAVVDGTGAVDDVAANVWALVEPLLAG